MKKLSMAVIAFMITITASAQFYIYYNDGNVIKVDSISMVAPEEKTDPYNGHEYVDLGLPSGLKWATCNVGAAQPEEYGDFFAWGETQPKDYYDWSTYKWCNSSDTTLTKYCINNSSWGTVDIKTTLDAEEEPASVCWGGAWRMPDQEEQNELRNNCTWTWITQNGVNGYKVTSNSNGNSIFLPAAGYCSASSLYDAGSEGYYWSRFLYTGYSYSAWRVSFDSSRVSLNSNIRCIGFSVRPVCP